MRINWLLIHYSIPSILILRLLGIEISGINLLTWAFPWQRQTERGENTSERQDEYDRTYRDSCQVWQPDTSQQEHWQESKGKKGTNSMFAWEIMYLKPKSQQQVYYSPKVLKINRLSIERLKVLILALWYSVVLWTSGITDLFSPVLSPKLQRQTISKQVQLQSLEVVGLSLDSLRTNSRQSKHRKTNKLKRY